MLSHDFNLSVNKSSIEDRKSLARRYGVIRPVPRLVSIGVLMLCACSTVRILMRMASHIEFQGPGMDTKNQSLELNMPQKVGKK